MTNDHIPVKEKEDQLDSLVSNQVAVEDDFGETEIEDEKEENIDIAKGDTPRASLTKIEFVLVFVAMAMGVFLAALDQTIVAVTLVPLAEEFNDLNNVVWIGTAYLLTSTALIPLYGKLADIFDRKPTFIFAIAIFEIGSLLCGASNSMVMLIISRAIAGIGGAGIMSLVLIIISDLVPLRDRPNYQGIIGAVFGLASVVGPLLGGAFTDYVSWRWCYYINLPIGGVTLLVVWWFLRLPRRGSNLKEGIKRIDWLGTFLLISAVILILIPLNLGGIQYAWNSGFVIGMLIGGAALAVLFLLSQIYVSKEPILPMSIWQRNTVPVFISAFFLGMSFFGVVFYSPLYFQVVNGDTATASGIKIIPLILGVVFFSLGTGALTGATGIYMPLISVGGILISVGTGLISTLNENSNQGQQIGYLLITGAGVGCCIQTILVAAQASIDPSLISIAISNTNFIQTLGAVFGLAISSTIFGNTLAVKVVENLNGISLPPGISAEIFQNNPALIREILVGPLEPLQKPIIRSYVQGLSLMFLVVIGYGAALLLASLFIRKDRIAKENRAPPAVGA